MTHRHDVARDRAIAARWCALAEQRLEHLTEMFETGRWRRYHSELAFLENIREAKRVVETWRALATGEAAAASQATAPVSPRWTPPPAMPAETKAVQPKAVQIAPKTTVPVRLAAEILAQITAAPTVPSADPPARLERGRELAPAADAIEARYPVLKNTF
jgi:uncharacterized repeat protein (TIGR03809 family)